ncbi:Zinc finger protein 316 [Dissostichus eleginoides]|uniref:Zinc finger protein 316 n=1 Tax=Dissostichus eleginoides TaxID=100907 RepID=A0AAD9BT73_DISEL|nr:Zinc finger protein 316 [Dissostichus eleginoides]
MFYWKNSSESVEEMSKCDILRGIVTEKLSTALQEILAVLQRTVSGYEEEASGLRREISQQNIQLELLKPRINLQRRDDEDHVVVSSEEEEEQQQPAEQETGSLGMLWYDDDDEEEEQPKPDPKDPDFQITPRVAPPRASDRPQREVIIRVCILEDARTLVLSNTVFDRCPVQELCFPRGLSEEQFLLLLRSSFPRLTDDFEFFTSDRTKTLKLLQVDSLTPEKISSSIRSSNLYIRLKKGESPSGSVTSSADETEAYSRLSPPRVQTARRRRGRPPLEKKQTNNLLLRVCMLGTCRSDVLSNKGKQEEDFLLLLRSSFPRLTDSSRLEFLRTDRSRRLQRLQLERLTPEDILRTRSSGGEKTLPVQHADPCSSNTSQEQEVETQEIETQEVETQEVETQEVETQEAAESSDDEIANEASDGDWKPDAETRQSGAKRGKFGGKNLCKVCGISYVLLGSLVKHAWSHVDEEEAPYRKSHMRTHTNEAPYECKECGRFFKRKTHLNNHVRGHLGIKLFVCSICGKACSRQEHLTVHMRTHNGERPYQCTVCAKAFTQSHCLKTHMKSHRQGDEGFLNATCP